MTEESLGWVVPVHAIALNIHIEKNVAIEV